MLLLALAALALGVLAGCGSGSGSHSLGTVPETTAPVTPPAPGTTTGPSTPEGPAAKKTVLHLNVVGEQLRFDKKSLSAPAGTVTLILKNGSAIPHDIAVKGHGVAVKGPVVTHGTSSVTAVLKAGSYTFYCAVPGHADAGMIGTLTVH